MPQSVQQNSSTQDVQTPKVSVVIPLYYAEDYIDDLLTQLRGQPLRDIEIICVIDGSPDGTLDIVKRHAGQDARIQWLYQENAGAGAARNAGLERTRGNYLAFLDADDLYDSQFLTKMYNAAVKHDADLVVCQFKHVDCKTGRVLENDGFRFDRVPVEAVFGPQDLKDPFSDIFVIPHNKLFKREMVVREDLRFSITRVSNDNFFVLSSIAVSKRIVAIADSMVEVRRYVNPQSISTNRALHAEDMFTSYCDLYNWLVRHGLFDSYRAFYVKSWADNFHYNATYDRNERFIKCAAKTLACEEPWCTMSDRELQRAARFDTGLIRIKRFLAARLSDTEVRDLELRRLNNEEQAIADVVGLLKTEYGKKLSVSSSMLRGVFAFLGSNGIRHSVARLVSRVK